MELAGEAEGGLIILVGHRRAGIGTHVEVFIPLHGHGNGLFHLPGGDHLAVDLEIAGSAAAQATGAAVLQCSGTQTIVFEVEFKGVPAGSQLVRSFPLDALKAHQVPGVHRLALQQVEAVAGKAAAMGHQHAFGTSLGNLHLGLDVVGGGQEIRCIAVGRTRDFPGVGEHGSAGGEIGTGLNRAGKGGGIHRQHLVPLRFLPEQLFQFLDLRGILGSHIVELSPVLVQVIQLPWPGFRMLVGRSAVVPGHTHDLGAEDPAIVVDRVVADHLEILGLVRRGCVGVLRVECIHHAHAIHGILLDAVNHLGQRNSGRFEKGRRDVDNVMELVTDAALVLDHPGPGYGHALLGAAKVGADHFGPGERRAKGPGPAYRHVGIGLVRSPGVVVLHLCFHRQMDALNRCDFVRRTGRPAFRAGAVVAADVDDQGVIEPAQILDRLDHAADFMVGVGHVGGEYLRLLDEQLLLGIVELVPLLDQVIGPWRQLGILGDNTEFLLIGEDGFAQLVPAFVEQLHLADLVDPLRCRMMRRMGCAGHVIDKKGLFRVQRVDGLHVVNGLVRHRRDQVEIRVGIVWVDLGGVAVQVARLPLAGVPPP